MHSMHKVKAQIHGVMNGLWTVESYMLVQRGHSMKEGIVADGWRDIGDVITCGVGIGDCDCQITTATILP